MFNVHRLKVKCRVFELYYRKVKNVHDGLMCKKMFKSIWCLMKWCLTHHYSIYLYNMSFSNEGFYNLFIYNIWIKNELFRALFWYSKHLLRKIQLNTQLLDSDTTWWQTFAATWWQKLWLDTLNAFKKPKDIICNEVSFLRIFCN